MLNWRIKPYHELSTDELYDILALRCQVFIVEQQCLYVDLDYRDQNAIHLMGYADKQLLAYARILPHADESMMSIGRVLTATDARSKQYGKTLMQQALNYLNKHYPGVKVSISAQHYLIKFYQSFGFETQGDIYDEDGIPHIRMDYHKP